MESDRTGPTRPTPSPPASPYVHFLDPREGRPVNPNTPEGELRNMAAFAAGVHRMSPGRRNAAKAIVWLILVAALLTVVAGVLAVAGTF